MKHPFKKLGSLLAVTVMIMGSVVGCTSSGDKKEEATTDANGGDKKIEGTLDVAVFEGGFGTATPSEYKEKYNRL